jgi:hypothetical protein
MNEGVSGRVQRLILRGNEIYSRRSALKIYGGAAKSGWNFLAAIMQQT